MCVCSGNHPLPNQPDELSVSFDLGWRNFICSDLATHSRKMSTMRHLKRGLPAVMPNEHSVTCQPYSEELYINLKKQGPLRQELCQSNQWSPVSPASIIAYGGFLKWWYPKTMGFSTKYTKMGLMTWMIWVIHILGKLHCWRV